LPVFLSNYVRNQIDQIRPMSQFRFWPGSGFGTIKRDLMVTLQQMDFFLIYMSCGCTSSQDELFNSTSKECQVQPHPVSYDTHSQTKLLRQLTSGLSKIPHTNSLRSVKTPNFTFLSITGWDRSRGQKQKCCLFIGCLLHLMPHDISFDDKF